MSDEPDGPWQQGAVTCTACGRHWQAVRPYGTEPLECPDCGRMSGRADPEPEAN
jgi:predicted RNA-binding Zn-ribbon protein involved in translation (DUF1610 family)